MAYVTSVCVDPLNFALASLALLSYVGSVYVCECHSSNFVELCSLKTTMPCSNEFVRFVCFCMVHKVFVYCHITSLKG